MIKYVAYTERSQSFLSHIRMLASNFNTKPDNLFGSGKIPDLWDAKIYLENVVAEVKNPSFGQGKYHYTNDLKVVYNDVSTYIESVSTKTGLKTKICGFIKE